MRSAFTWRSCSNVSGTSWKLLEEEFTTYQEHLARYLKKMLQFSRNVLQVTWWRCLIVAGTSGKLFEEEFTNIRNVLQVTHRRCYNVSGTSGKLLEEDVATYQERFATYLQKTLQHRCWSGSFRSNPCSIPVPDPYHSDLESFTFCCETVEYVRIFPFFCNHIEPAEPVEPVKYSWLWAICWLG